ncbi:MAG: hypothetical protein WHS86_03005 [Desulfosoma sp.]
MSENQTTALEELVSLAKDYDAKRRELDALARDVSSDDLLRHLLALCERATDRFRAAQHVLFQSLFAQAPPETDAVEAARAMCRSFDEMVLLFHKLVDHNAPSP